MNATALRGKMIQRVYQQLLPANSGQTWTISAIQFTDGSVLRFITVELEDGYATEGVYPARAIDDNDRDRYPANG